jgi:imidazole glycerol-phosphate synthase subunit HisH
MITIVDYGVGNVASLVNMFEHVGAKAMLSDDPDVVARANQLILPGVGAFDHAMDVLNGRGLADAVRLAVDKGASLLGVCLGMQLLARSSEEGHTQGLGLIPADVKRILPSDTNIKVPNMGWREAEYRKTLWMTPKSPMTPERFYFAHSYHMVCDRDDHVVATIEYDGRKTIAVANGSIFGVQFHPEKSHRFGMRLLSDFAQLNH